MDKKRLKCYLDPEQKGFLSPCDIGRILKEWFSYLLIGLFLLFMDLLPGSMFMDLFYGEGNGSLSFIITMPWYGLIVWILFGILWWVIIFLIIIIFSKGFEFLIDSCIKIKRFIKRKTKICTVKLLKINHSDVEK